MLTEGRFAALRATGLVPLVGRTQELALLLERWDQAKAGEGQVVQLLGEPGIGKSRVLESLRERLGGRAPYSRPLLLLALPQQQRIASDHGATRARRRPGARRPSGRQARQARTAGGASRPAASWRGPGAGGIARHRGGRALCPAGPDASAAEGADIRSLARAPLRSSGPAACTDAYEDLHWVDPTTLELLDLVVSRIEQQRVLVVATCRPEWSPRWIGHPNVSLLTINRLSRALAASIVDGMLQGRDLPAAIRDQILARTDGVPLFVEELTRAVLDADLVGGRDGGVGLHGQLPPLAIPATLQDSLMARLDRLAPVKEVAQTGAVIGREFSFDLLSTVSPMAREELADALDKLVAADLVFQRGSLPEATYVFKHSLVQDAAYQSLAAQPPPGAARADRGRLEEAAQGDHRRPAGGDRASLGECRPAGPSRRPLERGRPARARPLRHNRGHRPFRRRTRRSGEAAGEPRPGPARARHPAGNGQRLGRRARLRSRWRPGAPTSGRSN